jgi:hypothetical protein
MLQDFANVAQVIGALAVIVAIAFGLVQMRQYRQQRRDAVAVELMRSIQDAEFTRSLRMLLTLPIGCTAEQFRTRGAEYEDAAIALIAKYETLGYLVYRGIMPLELVEELVGGVGIHLWDRLQRWARAVRDQQGQPMLFEWFQWLAEVMQRRGRLQAVPAYLRHAEWVAPPARRPAAR